MSINLGTPYTENITYNCTNASNATSETSLARKISYLQWEFTKWISTGVFS
jgi:hypothetical protein